MLHEKRIDTQFPNAVGVIGYQLGISKALFHQTALYCQPSERQPHDNSRKLRRFLQNLAPRCVRFAAKSARLHKRKPSLPVNGE